MSALGKLTASVILDTAEFTVGTDKAKYLAAQAATSIDKSMRDMERSISGVLGSLAAAVSAGALINFVKQAIDAQAAMEDMAAKAGTTAEAISRFDAPARMAGSSLEFVSGAMFKLGKAALEAQDSSSKSAQALHAIGISASELKGLKPDEMFELIARQLAKYSDGLERNAVVQQLLGKSGAEANKVISEIAKTTELASTITNEEAEAAKKLESQFVTLHMNSEKMWRGIANEFVPALTAITGSFIQGQREGGLYEGMVRGVTEAFSQMKGDGPAAQLKKIRDEMEATRKEAERLSNLPAWMKLFYTDSEMKGPGSNFAALAAQRDALEHQMSVDAITEQDRRALAGIKPGVNYNPAGAAGSSAYAAENAELDKKIAKLTGIGELDAYIERLEEARFKTLSPLQKQELIDKETLLLALGHQIEYTNSYNKVLDELEAAEQAKIDRARKIVEGTKDSNDLLKFEIENIGNSTTQIALNNVERERTIALKGIDSPLSIDEINKAYDLKAALVAQRGALIDQTKVWEDISASAGKFFADLIVNGKSAFDRLRENLKNFAQELIALFAQRWILQIAAGVTGSSALGNAAASVGGNSASGLVTSAIGSYVGRTAIGEGFQMGWGSGVAGPSSGFGEQAGAWLSSNLPMLGYFAIAIAGAAIASSQYSQGWRINQPGGTDYTTNNPVAPLFMASAMDRTYRALGLNDRWAGILSGSSLATRIFGNRQRQNDAYGVEGTVGDTGVTGGNWQDWSEQGGWFSSTRRGTDRTQFSGEQSTFFSQMMGSVTSLITTLGTAIHADPGTALAGYSHPFTLQLNENGEPLSEDALKTLFSNLFGTVLQEQATIVFNSVGMSRLATTVQDFKGTGDEIASFIDSLISIIEVVSRNPMEDLSTAIEASSHQFETTMRNNVSAVRSVMQAYDGTLTTTQNLATATATYYNAQLQLLAGITQISQQVNAMFNQTFTNIRLAGMDTQGRYNYYQNDAEVARRLIGTESDPDLVRQLAERINSDINAAFGLLTPEQQAAQSAAFIEQGRQAQIEITNRLTAIQTQATAATQSTLNEIRDLIGAGAATQDKAANTQERAANLQAAVAAAPPRTLNLRVDVVTGTASVTDGG